VNNWKRLGFTDADVAEPGSDQLLDAVVAHGTADQVAKRLSETSRPALITSRSRCSVTGTSCCDVDRAGRRTGAD